MKRVTMFCICILIISCAEELIQKPENLIPSEKMIDILNDLSILNAAKTTQVNVFENNNINIMKFLFEKYDIDSAQFVRSNRYYASRTVEYESIYSKVEQRLETENKRLKEVKQLKDSLNQIVKDSIINSKYAKEKVTDDLK